MATRINLRGVIVSSMWDTDWTQEYIEKGIIAPESAFRRQLDAVDGDVDIYVNSPGGSVFSGYEMSNAVNERVANGDRVTITVGAMAASAAANFLLQTRAAEVNAHGNAKIMFHGASTGIVGGKEALEDEAELLGKINDEMKVALITTYGLDSDTVNEWFAEGREGWLTAQEAKEAGIVSSLIGEDAEALEFDPASIEDITNRGLKIAAFAEVSAPVDEQQEEIQDEPEPEQEQEENESAEDQPDDGVNTGGDDGQDDGDVGDETGEDDTEAEVSEESKEEPEAEEATVLTVDFEALANDELKLQIAELNAKHAEDLKKRDAVISKLQSERDKALNDVKQANEKAEELAGRIDKLLGPALTFHGEDTSVNTWEDALEAAGGDYATARKEHPALYDAFMEHKAKTAK